MANRTIDDFSAVVTPATTDTLIVTQAAVAKKETLAQIDTLLSATTKTLTNKTLASPIINTAISGTAIDTDGTLAANSNTLMASQKAVKTYADTKIATSLFDANTILAANSDNTPAALTIAEQRVIGRITGGNIIGLTAAQIKTLLSISAFAETLLDDTTAAAFKTTTLAAGDIVQVVNYQTGAVATGTTAIPDDDTIPQITEGNEFMTLAITPTSATNKLLIEVVFIGSSSALSNLGVALFQDSTAGALAAVQMSIPATYGAPLCFKHYMTAGTTSSTTFRVRAGHAAGATTTFNGRVGARLFGGVYASSITITEVQV